MNKLYINYDNNIHTCTCKQTNGASTVCKMLMGLYLVLVCQHGLIL